MVSPPDAERDCLINGPHLNLLATESLLVFPERIARLLNSRAPRKLEGALRARAAVLMPIFQRQEDYCFLLTLRTHTVETHKGQISFPGGVKEPEDHSLLETALRETWEEIGLPQTRIQILGEFDDYHSVTDLVVTPYAGWVVPPLNLVLNRKEVEEILEVPLSLFRDWVSTSAIPQKRVPVSSHRQRPHDPSMAEMGYRRTTSKRSAAALATDQNV